ncbi:hypothetical protein CK203_058658 [Vitis vinifera]|uniref:Transposase n=1 Tax=Vitis vinifera TaxID=29760 RepID=A0A438FTI0_VITVI|nr:hypothetical protein CK203_058658 [Vitis vinifera]
MLSMNNEIPLSMYEAKKTLNALGMEYKKIHACPNDCILYRNELNDASSCPTCGMSRWKVNKARARNSKRIPKKVLWYFPPIPRKSTINASNGAQFGVETKKLQPLQANHSKLKEAFCKVLRNHLLLRSDFAAFLYSRVYFLLKLPDICRKLGVETSRWNLTSQPCENSFFVAK